MDNLVRTLRELADNDAPSVTWGITNNGSVIKVEGTSKDSFDTPGDAFAEAERIARELVADGQHKIVNRAELTAVTQPYADDSTQWRGKVEVLLWPAEELEEYHRPIDLD